MVTPAQLTGIADLADRFGSELLHPTTRQKSPLNFVKTKIALAGMEPGQTLQVLLDDGAPIENVPRSVQAEGHRIVLQERVGAYWSVAIRNAA